MKGIVKKQDAPATRPYGMACMTCRRMKIKCINSGIQPNRCDRCIKLDKVCLFEPQRRRLTRRDENANRPNLPAPEPLSRPSGRSSSGVKPWPSQPHCFQRPREQTALTDSDETSSPNSSRGQPPPKELYDEAFAAPSFITQSEDTRTLSLDAALDPERSLRPGTNSNHERNGDSLSDRESAREKDDPINARILNRPSAQHLFEGYFTHFEYHLGFLDPGLYTFIYTRSASSFLFTTILTTAARVFRPDLYPGLKAHQETLLGRALLTCDASQETVWAIALGYSYKELGDNRGFALVGFAIRLAISSEWNVLRRSINAKRKNTTMKETAHQVRLRRDQERVWLFLSSLERTLSIFTDRPLLTAMNETEVASRAWMSEANDKTYGYGDVRAIAGLELTVIAKPVHDYLCSSREIQRTGYEAMQHHENDRLMLAMDKYNRDMVSWADYWAPLFRSHETGPKCRASQVYLYRDHLRTYFHSILLHRVLTANHNDIKAPCAMAAAQVCYSTSINLLQETLRLSKMDVLYYLWDTCHLMIASSAMVLLKIIKQAANLPGISVEIAYEVLKDVADALTTAANSYHDRETYPPDMRHKIPAENTLDAQARLLRAIVLRVRADLLPHQAEPFRAQPTPMSFRMPHMSTPCLPVDGCNYDLSPLPPDMMADDLLPQMMTGDLYDQGGLQMDLMTDGEAFGAEELAYEMNFSLDTSFIDSRFMDAGLRGWDEPGMFYGPK